MVYGQLGELMIYTHLRSAAQACAVRVALAASLSLSLFVTAIFLVVIFVCAEAPTAQQGRSAFAEGTNDEANKASTVSSPIV
jgi:hypothetical protein